MRQLGPAAQSQSLQLARLLVDLIKFAFIRCWLDLRGSWCGEAHPWSFISFPFMFRWTPSVLMTQAT